jgi:hypothetical protein
MASDPSQMRWGYVLYAFAAGKKAEFLQGVNDALAELRDRGGRWWLYTVSHRTFELVVGDPCDPDNLVIAMDFCDQIAGPVCWPNQRLRVVWDNDRETTFVVEDESVGFKAVGRLYGWSRGYNLVEHGSLYDPSLRRQGQTVGPDRPLLVFGAASRLSGT